MAIPLPKPDDKTYDDLVDEARAALPAIYPAWTDHNASDPGVALIELLAWLTELITYRTGPIPEQSERAFLRLLSGGAHGDEGALDVELEATLRDLREPYRAVTAGDYEELLATAWPSSQPALSLAAGLSRIARARGVAERDLSAADKLAPAPGHMSLAVLPWSGDAKNPWLPAPPELLAAIVDFFRERRLITTQLHVTPVPGVPIDVTATVYLRDDARAAGKDVIQRVNDALVNHFHPWTGGSAGQGWPFGRAVDLSDVSAVIDGVSGVQFVEGVQLKAPPDARGERDSDKRVLGIRIEADELPRVEEKAIKLTLKERVGGEWKTIA